MTANQIAYWNLVETKRANQAKEMETNRSNVAKETETQRHNVEQEQLGYAQNQIADKTANANVLNANTQSRKADFEEELLPYEKWNKATSSAKNITSGIGDIIKGVTSFFKFGGAKS